MNSNENRPAAARRPLRVVHFTGPGDIVTTFEHWSRGEHDPRETSITYSGQFYDVCERLDLQTLVIGCNANARRVARGRFQIEQRRIPWDRAGGLRFHLGRLFHGLWMIWRAVLFRADVVVVAMGTHWFILAALRLFGIRIVPTLHCTLWTPQGDDLPPDDVIARLDRWFFRRCCTAILSASHDIALQVGALTAGRHAPLVEFLPTYSRETFRDVAPMAPGASPFRVLYIGRIEEVKGVFDLLEVCGKLSTDGLDVAMDLCGDGSALGALKAKASEMKLDGRFRCHGHTRREDVVKFLGKCHVLVVPTRTSFTEGFAMTVVEGVLAQRPVVTSSVCPALRYVRRAAIEVAPDDPDEYRRVICELYADRARLLSMSREAREVGEMFYDERRGWGHAVEAVLQCIRDGRAVPSVSWLPN